MEDDFYHGRGLSSKKVSRYYFLLHVKATQTAADTVNTITCFFSPLTSSKLFS